MSVTASAIIKRLGELKSARQAHEATWRDCYEYTYPLRGSGLAQQQLDAQQGEAQRAKMLDATATDAVRILAAALMSGNTPANSRWFGLYLDQETELAQRWLDQCADTLWQNIHMANFDAEAYEAMVDLVCAGWFALYIEEAEQGGLHFAQWPIAQVYAASSRPGGRIDIVYRSFTLTAEQALRTYGDEVSDKTAGLASTKPDEKIEFVQAIYPRDTQFPTPQLARNLPIASVTVEVGQRVTVRESGYHEMPVIVPRWMQIPQSAYGVGPVYDALPDIRMLNELKRMQLAAADLAIAGMWIAEDDGVLNPRTIKVGPRKIIVANSTDSMKPLETGGNFQLSEILIEQLQGAIRKTLMADQLQPQDGPAMTATEVHVRVNLIRQLLGPIYGRMQAEYLQMLIERCFGLAYRAGVFGDAPQDLAGQEFNVRYLSPLARAQKLDDVGAIERMVADVGQLAQVLPGVLDLVDADQAVRVIHEALGVPQKVIRTTQDVDELRAQQAQAQQDMQQQAITAQVQQTAGQELAKNLAGRVG